MGDRLSGALCKVCQGEAGHRTKLRQAATVHTHMHKIKRNTWWHYSTRRLSCDSVLLLILSLSCLDVMSNLSYVLLMSHTGNQTNIRIIQMLQSYRWDIRITKYCFGWPSYTAEITRRAFIFIPDATCLPGWAVDWSLHQCREDLDIMCTNYLKLNVVVLNKTTLQATTP